MKETDDLIMKADLLTLFGLLSKLADYSQGKEDKELIRILLSLDEFVEIHKTRTRDMIVYRDTIERARDEYRSLKLKYTGLEELLAVTKDTLHKVMNEKINTDADYGF